MRSPWASSRLFKIIAEILLALTGSAIIALYVPWDLVFNASIPSGGDNPAHPVLMESIGEAFFEHLRLVHYSYSFWGGFEAFQFYFPLSYWIGACLARVMDPNIAYKLVTLFGILGLPPAFYAMAAILRMSIPARALAGLLCVPFLFTEAHVMWGGNIFSALAGMIGNAWGFVFFTLAFGLILRAGIEGRFTPLGLLCAVLASMSHFYTLLMLFMLYGAFLAQDLVVWVRTRRIPFERWKVYAVGAAAFLLMAWWILPLSRYRPFSSDLGGDWGVKFLGTFNLAERVFFSISLVVAVFLLFRRKSHHPKVLITSMVFLGFYLLFYSFNDIFRTTAFIKIRLWPSIYFALYFIGIAVADDLYRLLPKPVFAALIPALWFLVPPETAFNNSRSWMEWNYSGLEAKQAWPELRQILDMLRAEPSGRVSYESANEANGIIGSVRTPELIPYLTHHEIILGGIVNSANYAGIGYMLHCLSSESCAGWPPGSIMPEKDNRRSIEMMQSLGIRYHLAIHKNNRDAYSHSDSMETLYAGNQLALFKLKATAPDVEVFSADLPVFCSKRALNSLLNFPRWDKLRRAGVIFDEKCTMTEDQTARWATFLVDEWNAGRRVYDRGWKDRTDRISSRLNLYFFAFHHRFDPGRTLTESLETFIADRGFDPHVLATNTQEGYSEVGVPLLRLTPGSSPIRVVGRGYKAFVGSREIPMEQTSVIDFPLTEVNGIDAPFTWLVFKPDPAQPYRYIELFSDDSAVRTAIPSTGSIELPRKITENCGAEIKKEFHKLTLKTRCPGKPHLIKYSYFPKWEADVPIQIGTNGFMVLTPKNEVTVIEHSYRWPDWVGLAISWLTFLLLIGAGLRSLLKSRSLQANRLPQAGT